MYVYGNNEINLKMTCEKNDKYYIWKKMTNITCEKREILHDIVQKWQILQVKKDKYYMWKKSNITCAKNDKYYRWKKTNITCEKRQILHVQKMTNITGEKRQILHVQKMTNITCEKRQILQLKKMTNITGEFIWVHSYGKHWCWVLKVMFVCAFSVIVFSWCLSVFSMKLWIQLSTAIKIIK